MFDVRGSSVVTLHNGLLSTGENLVNWDGKDRRGKTVATGTYIYALFIDGKLKESQTMIFMK